ncbi:formylmethanofuran dehydrogenase subunit B [Candidatus Bathyarchaeota archaeon]|jgi:formylmethanofuran dehydrogenase subunit B|nr:formylmethanofuran dehydrogenase subunit B [Candidatus Bathyarchaeota archaeon]
MEVINDVVCPFCGCLCDDLEVSIEENHISKIKNACAISRSKFLNHNKNRLTSPTIDGQVVSLDQALDAVIDVLTTSRRPLVYGLSSTECEAIGKAIEIAERTGGVIDNTSSVCHGPTILALQQVGESKTTLGEVKNRCDLVIFWGCNPTQAHLRHLLRYSGIPKGLFTPEGRKNRFIVAVDIRETATTKMADKFVKIKPNRDFELLQALSASVRGNEVPDVAGVSKEEITEIAELMKKSKFGIIFFGLGLTQSMGRHMNIDAAALLVAELNHHTKFLLTPMRGHYNVAGANTVTTWQTGYPYAVDFSRGYPRYNPGEYTSIDMLARGEADAALIIASDPAATFPANVVRELAKIPIITLDQKITPTTMLSKVAIPVATAGIEAEGTAYRMDGVPLRLSKLLEPENEVKSDAVILDMIIERMEGKR